AVRRGRLGDRESLERAGRVVNGTSPRMIDWQTWIGTLVAVVLALGAVAVVVRIVRHVVAVVARRLRRSRDLYARTSIHFTLLLSLVWLWVACAVTAPRLQEWWPALSHAFLIAVIVAAAWFVSALASFGITRVMVRYSGEDALSVEMRRMHTQLSVVRRLVAVLIAVIAIGAVLFTFPEVRAIGTSVLASAGIVSIVAGLAAQS